MLELNLWFTSVRYTQAISNGILILIKFFKLLFFYIAIHATTKIFLGQVKPKLRNKLFKN